MQYEFYSDINFTALGKICFVLFQTFIHENPAVEKFVQENRLLEGNFFIIFFYPFIPGGLFYLTRWTISISKWRDAWLILLSTSFIAIPLLNAKRCRHRSDAAFCSVWSGFTLFVNESIMGRYV